MQDRSPLHSDALNYDDLTPRRKVIVFNIHTGIAGTYTIVSSPPARRGNDNGLRISLRPVPNGDVESFCLVDIGIIPYANSGWNPVNFMIDYDKRHSLPRIPPGGRVSKQAPFRQIF